MIMQTKLIVNMAVAFVVGVACGITFNNWQVGGRVPPPLRHHGPRDPENFLLDRLKESVMLTPEQEQQVRKILEGQRQKLDSLRDEARPRFDAIRDETHDLIRVVLTPDQQQRFDRWHEEVKKFAPPFPPPGENGPGPKGRDHGGPDHAGPPEM